MEDCGQVEFNLGAVESVINIPNTEQRWTVVGRGGGVVVGLLWVWCVYESMNVIHIGFVCVPTERALFCPKGVPEGSGAFDEDLVVNLFI